MPSTTLLPAPPQAIPAIEVSGLPIEVGLLPDGTPFMSGRELARACGISNSTLVGWGEATPQVGDRYRAGKLANLLATYNYQGERLFLRIPDGTQFGGRANVSAYPYQVCLAFLDYYAFEANKEAARNSLRLLSEKQLPQFICEVVQTPPALAEPPQPIQPKYDPFRQRPLRDGIPVGYFSVGQLLASEQPRSLPLTELRTALLINIDKAWNRYWNIQCLSREYGDRFAMPQRSLNDWARPRQYVYPKAALVAFQDWLALHYLPERYPSYLQRKRQQLASPFTHLKLLPQAS
ncbi:hypothetical protein [Leptolyngbya iicbica]|uniref:BstA-like C-terminal domain-containing protein n=2 Tax=Cyanophyceae TaxID=3028117 RepID=A0A4Q7EJ42_9CYAN|nr:hypothetical protein [Leptolyngbya sp. LK]RZM81809.1 hypothetical protein DYY88_00560 [Leptolyngbya sp. LK]